MQLSRLENEVLEKLKSEGLSVFRVNDVSLLLKFSKVKTYNVLKALKKKQAIEPVQAGFFAIAGASDFAVGAGLNWPSYLSFWSALNYHDLSDQTPKVLFFASVKRKRFIKGFKYVVLSRKRFFGYFSAGEAVVAEVEKAIVDCLLFPKYSGGAREIFSALKAGLKELNVKKLADYALRVESKAVVRRLGFLLEECGFKGKELELLSKHKGNGFELLDPSLKRKNNFEKKWLLDINW
jgi:predicted transcriptional regulator of viral defense system